MELLLIASWILIGIIGTTWASNNRPYPLRIRALGIALGWLWVPFMAVVVVKAVR